MQKDHKFFEDITRMASSASGTLLEMKREVESMAAAQVDKVLRRMDLVTQEEFKLLRDMASKARAENEQLQARVAELEKKLGIPSAAGTPAKAGTRATPSRSAAKKPTAAKKPVAKAPAKKAGKSASAE